MNKKKVGKSKEHKTKDKEMNFENPFGMDPDILKLMEEGYKKLWFRPKKRD